ncbi:unnamed protein product [Malus baccata var. baccata]
MKLRMWLVLLMHMRELDMRLRVRAERWQVVIVPAGEWKLLLLLALLVLLFIIIMGCHLVAIKAEEHLILVVNAKCIKEGHHLVDRRMVEIWNFKEQHMLKENKTCVAL